jgi:rare lipoprotein A
MTSQSGFHIALMSLFAVFLTACVSSPPPTNTANAGRYEMANDSPELEPIDFQMVPEVIPKEIIRTAAGNKSPYSVNGRSYIVMDSEVGYQETGMASWYGRKFHGHLTSNGEIYDMFQYSAAHKSLPIPSFARVTNLNNGRTVVVRVNDRGPFHESRIIDLSYAAAARLDYAANGTARVRVESLTPWLNAPPILVDESANPIDQEAIAAERQLIEANQGEEFLQVGAFSNLDSAENLRDSIAALTRLPAIIRSELNEGAGQVLHRVRLGPVNETIALDDVIQLIIDAGLGTPFRVRQ